MLGERAELRGMLGAGCAFFARVLHALAPKIFTGSLPIGILGCTHQQANGYFRSTPALWAISSLSA